MEDFCATNIAQEMKGMVRSTYQPTIDSGSCVDFAITSRSMIPLTTIQEDWTAPIKPHAAVILAVHESLGYWPLPQLKGFQGDLHEHTAVQGIIADVTMSNDPVMLAFPLFSFKVEESNYEKRQGRGWRNPLVMQPLLKTVYPGTWIGQGVAIWDRVSRALVPRSLTQLPHYARGRESIKRTGCWSNPSLVSAEGLVFGTDASGGVGSKDPRTGVVSWAVIAGRRPPQGIRIVGSISGRLEQGATVSQAMAMVQLLAHTEGKAMVISDSRLSISQAEAKVFKAAHWPIWQDWFYDRHRVRADWIGSHQDKLAYLQVHGNDNLWKWQINDWADKLAEDRSAEVDISASQTTFSHRMQSRLA